MLTPGIRKRILTGSSGPEWRATARVCAADPADYDVLVGLLGDERAAVAKRAAYVFTHAGEYAPALTLARLPVLVPLLDRTVHPGTRRAICRSLTFIDLPPAWVGPVLDRCFGYLEDVQERTAVRVFSADIIYRNTADYPELRAELRRLLEWAAPAASPGLSSKIRRLLPLLAP